MSGGSVNESRPRVVDPVDPAPTAAESEWRAEASGLAYMICQIADRYRQAKHLGGDSELLASAIFQSEQYVNGPMLERFTDPAGDPE